MEGGVCLVEEVTWEPSRDSPIGEEGALRVDEAGRKKQRAPREGSALVNEVGDELVFRLRLPLVKFPPVLILSFPYFSC